MKQRCPVHDFCSISHSHLRDAFISQCGSFAVCDFGGIWPESQENLSGTGEQQQTSNGQLWAVLSGLFPSAPSYSCHSVYVRCQVSGRTTGNWLRALSSCFGLGLFKVLFFCSSQMKFLGLCRSPGIKVKEGHCGSGRKWWYLKLVLPMRTQAVSPVSQREITGLTAIFC